MAPGMKRFRSRLAVCLPLAALLASASGIARVPATPSSTARPEHAIQWQKSAVDNVFAMAKASNKPVFLYWGAAWCPPCNQVKATIFNRQDFVEKSRFFLPVYIDGDHPGAQKLGARFNVRGYPTMILFKPNGEEITRLPGEVDAERYMQVLSIGINATRPVKELLASALANPADGHPALSMDDWRLLAFYSWDTDEQQLVPAKDAAVTLKRLAAASRAVAADISARFALRALIVEAAAKHAETTLDADAIDQVLGMLENPRLAHENFDLIANHPDEVLRSPGSPPADRQLRLRSAWKASLERLIEDGGLSAADRLAAMLGIIAVARLEHAPGPLPQAVLQQARSEVQRAERLTTDRYARQSVISAASDVLTEAGLLDESDRLLKAELKRSHSPYYFMLGLAANARKRGDKAAAVGWAAKAYAAAIGPATRLQWGTSYVRTLIDLAAEDEAPIETAAKRILAELKTAPETFYERNLRSLERMGKNLREWNRENTHTAVVRRLQAQKEGICRKLPANDPSRAACDNVSFVAQS